MYLCGLESFQVGVDVGKPDGASTTVLGGGHRVHVDLTGLVEFGAEIERINGRLAKLDVEIGKLKGKLSNENYVSRAPAAVVQKDRDRVAAFEEEVATLKAQRTSLEALV
jgi:valyl-tRNA synthetase